MAFIGTILILIGGIICFIFGIMVLIQAFKKSILWGLGSLFIPLFVFVFIAKHWETCKPYLMKWLIGLALIVVGGILGGGVAGT
ncbi:MAG: hypothetical protein ACSHYF_04350 [Verrucomicrobiaceae bacterium]